MFEKFSPDDKCDTCGKKMIDLYEGRTECKPCFNEELFQIAKEGPIVHLMEALICLFNFWFSHAWIEFKWAFESLFGTGDFKKGGRFDQEIPGWRDRE